MDWNPVFFNVMKHLILSLILLSALNTLAQKAPPWVDYNYRSSTYPNSKYLIGFATEINIEKSRVLQANEKLNQMARNQIIESIHASIQAESQMNISVENTATNEAFEQSSKSASNGNSERYNLRTCSGPQAKTSAVRPFANLLPCIHFLFWLET